MTGPSRFASRHHSTCAGWAACALLSLAGLLLPSPFADAAAPMSGPIGTRTVPYVESKCSDPNVFFCEDFEDPGTAPIRTSSWGGCDGRWRNPGWASSGYCYNTSGMTMPPTIPIGGFGAGNDVYQITLKQGAIDGRLRDRTVGTDYTDYYIRYQFYYSNDVQWPGDLDIKQMLSHPELWLDPPSANYQNGPIIHQDYGCTGLGNFGDAIVIRYGPAYNLFPLRDEYCPPLAPGQPANNTLF
jgi:hypothetical protein